jgi:hypothetical protein
VIGRSYWYTGIEAKRSGVHDGKWTAKIAFFDDGFANQHSTEGVLSTRYPCDSLSIAVWLILEDAARLGLQFRNVMTTTMPTLWVAEEDAAREDVQEVCREHGLCLPFNVIPPLSVHTKNAHYCTCGKICRGNGYKLHRAKHRRLRDGHRGLTRAEYLERQKKPVHQHRWPRKLIGGPCETCGMSQAEAVASLAKR